MNLNKLKHVALISGGLLAAFAGVVYQGTLAGSQVSPTMTFGVLAGLLLVGWSRLQVVLGKADEGDVTKTDQIFHAAIGLAGLVLPVIVLVQQRYAPGSQAAIVAGYLATFLGDLRQASEPRPFNVPGPAKSIVALVLLVGVLSMPETARAAEPTPNDVAPPLSFCFGTTFNCVLPDFNLNTVAYNLDAKQWKVGATSYALGYMFLYASDKPWASGVALHGAGQWSQGAPSYFAIVPSLVIAKYFELGMSFVFLNGSIEKDLVLGISANAEIIMGLVTGKPIQARLAAAKVAYSEELAKQRAKMDEDEREAHEILRRHDHNLKGL